MNFFRGNTSTHVLSTLIHRWALKCPFLHPFSHSTGAPSSDLNLLPICCVLPATQVMSSHIGGPCPQPFHQRAPSTSSCVVWVTLPSVLEAWQV